MLKIQTFQLCSGNVKYNYENGKIVRKGSTREVTDLKSKSSYRKIGLPVEYIEILKVLLSVRLFATHGLHQAPLSMEFSRQEY